jgi:uncharacterized protein
MVIDFHTHVFPEQIAEKTIKKLSTTGKVKAFTDGTLEGLKISMRENHIDFSVTLPVLTKPEQFESINTYAVKNTGKDGIISFGGIHPNTEDYNEKLQEIKQLGLPGIKLHPNYQSTYVDDPKMIRMIQYATKLGLIVVLHAGFDIGLPDPVYCTPKRAANMLNQIDDINAKIVLAHTGGLHLWDDVEEEIVGKNVWIDISFSLDKISEDQFMRIVREHGADRVLFATDSPWSSQKETLERLKEFDLTEEELERILYRNAAELLKLQVD